MMASTILLFKKTKTNIETIDFSLCRVFVVFAICWNPIGMQYVVISPKKPP